MTSEYTILEIVKYVEANEENTNKVGQNLLEELEKEQESLTNDFPISKGIIEQALERYYADGITPGSEIYADVFNQNVIRLNQKLLLPIKQYPKINFTEKILGPQGTGLKQLEEATQCKIQIKGRNSLLDKLKEEELRESGDVRFKHLKRNLYLELSSVATPIECYKRMAYALGEIRKFVIPNEIEQLTEYELSESVKIEPEIKSEGLENDPLEVVSNEPNPAPALNTPQTPVAQTPMYSLADKLIKLLDETVLNPNFQCAEEKNTSEFNNMDILHSSIASKLANNSLPTGSSTSMDTTNTAGSDTKICTQIKIKNLIKTKKLATKRKLTKSPPKKLSDETVLDPNFENEEEEKTSEINNSSTGTDSYLKTRSQTKNQNLIKTKKLTTIRKLTKSSHKNRLLKTTFKHKDDFTGIFYMKNKTENKIIRRKISHRTTLNRWVKNSDKEVLSDEEEVLCEPVTLDYLQQNPTELVFEYTPPDVMFFLLETIKNYPVLWEFHDKPFNADFNEAIENLCEIINNKWSLQIDYLKMRRSINRILRFYRFLFPFEIMEKFADYFQECAGFLPSVVNEIPIARCFHCSLCFKEDSQLRRHLVEEEKSLNWPYKCKQCAESFEDSQDYEFHKRLPHYVEIFCCDQCHRRFNRPKRYKQHVDKHQPNRPEEPRNHACDICGKTFRSNYELRSHKAYHEEKKYKCHLCPNSYFQSNALMYHLKKHRKEFDFICEICAKTFTAQKSLNAHMEIHNNVQITCNICNIKLRKCNLFRHLRLMHVALEGTIDDLFRTKGFHRKGHTKGKRRKTTGVRDYKCKLCNIHFDRLKFLKQHNSECHTTTTRFSCKMCDTLLVHRTNLRRHYREKHGLEECQIYAIVGKDADIDTALSMTIDKVGAM